MSPAVNLIIVRFNMKVETTKCRFPGAAMTVVSPSRPSSVSGPVKDIESGNIQSVSTENISADSGALGQFQSGYVIATFVVVK